MHFRGSPIRDKVVIVDGKEVSVFLFLIFFRVASFIQAVSKVTVLIVIMRGRQKPLQLSRETEFEYLKFSWYYYSSLIKSGAVCLKQCALHVCSPSKGTTSRSVIRVPAFLYHDSSNKIGHSGE